MTVDLPPEVQPIVDQAIANGRGENESDVVCQALRLYEQLEKRRDALRREIEKGADSGDSISGELVFQELEELANQIAVGAAAQKQ